MEDFVTYEQAVKLKELGFPGYDCSYGYYTIKGNISFKRVGAFWDIPFLPAPTLAQAQKWLYEKHNLWIEVSIDDNTKTPFIYDIFQKGNCHDDLAYDRWSDKPFSEHPWQALSAGIDKAMELLINPRKPKTET